ncbi:hypothetical protein AWW66_32190 [Micromonospora rosaria]|uniref:Uncharacterized protein n=1 Tax=Micromonospora rosaria TaxID=47874 RepID=A0A136PI25_9ACTN|nr:hypothetical protein [Micromonospora rosaria]KXK58052.1 hypothetical protein AWW66_32190 [Micromonospora rosaria]
MSAIMDYARLRSHDLTERSRLLAKEPNNAYEYAADLRIGEEGEERASRGWIPTGVGRLAVPAGQAGPPIDVIGSGGPVTR